MVAIEVAITLLAIAKIRTDGGTQIRARIDADHVWRLVDALEMGRTLPPVVVFYDGTVYWLADGFHRVAAYDRLGREVPCDVRSGTRRDAVLYACGANEEHGLKRTHADRRNAVRTLLADEKWSKWSTDRIAKHARVRAKLVEEMQLELWPEPTIAPTMPDAAPPDSDAITIATNTLSAADAKPLKANVAAAIACELCASAPRARRGLCWACYGKLGEAGVRLPERGDTGRPSSIVPLIVAVVHRLGPAERATIRAACDAA